MDDTYATSRDILNITMRDAAQAPQDRQTVALFIVMIPTLPFLNPNSVLFFVSSPKMSHNPEVTNFSSKTQSKISKVVFKENI